MATVAASSRLTSQNPYKLTFAGKDQESPFLDRFGRHHPKKDVLNDGVLENTLFFCDVYTRGNMKISNPVQPQDWHGIFFLQRYNWGVHCWCFNAGNIPHHFLKPD